MNPIPDAINLVARLAVFADGTTTQITNLYDSSGEDTDDPTSAVVLVCETPDGNYAVLFVADYERDRVH
ncbi:hypothetical protein UFOVP706_53 [uncultured Caudovirales phage]|uniref:Uncharacterized protein n=1 Tax=uncultured Caudovirales phage TaxID=2100421 RepID=A0A6J5NK19_9CAUD|nr:hypothetical protein UFOVP706_53 [uncultured Caudovirales phage]